MVRICGRWSRDLGVAIKPRRIHLLIAVVVATALPVVWAGPAAADSPVVGSNVQINQDGPGSPQNEIDIAVNPSNALNVIGGGNDYRPEGGTGFYATVDGGATWTDGILPMPAGVASAGDPVVTFNRNGSKAFFTHLGLMETGVLGGCESQSGVYVSQSSTGGTTWGTSLRLAPNASNVFNDKPWVAVDRSTGISGKSGNVYATYSKFVYASASACQAGLTTSNSPIKLRRSTDGGTTWSGEVDVSGSFLASQGSVPAVAPNGTVFVAFESFTGCGDCIVVATSTNGGQSFTQRKVADISGVEEIAAGTQSFRADSFPSAVVDSTGAVHVVWNEPRAGATNNDVWISSSTSGASWTAPRRVNQSTQGDQFFPAIAVDAGGALYVSYSDRRDDPQNVTYLQYVSHSHDGGLSWTDAPVSSVSSDPRAVTFEGNLFIGDYNGIDALPGGGVWMAWCDTRNSGASGEQDAFAARIQPSGAVTTTTATVTPSIGVWGTTFSLTGRLTESGNPLASRTIVVQERAFGAAGWTTVGTAPTVTDGTFTRSLGKPGKNTEYRAIFTGTAGFRSSTSPTRRADIRVGVPINVQDSTLLRGQTATFFGQILPGHPGRKVMLQQLTNSGWVTLQTVTLDSVSRFTATARLTVAGFRLFRATYATQDLDHVWNISRNIGVTWS